MKPIKILVTLHRTDRSVRQIWKLPRVLRLNDASRIRLEMKDGMVVAIGPNQELIAQHGIEVLLDQSVHMPISPETSITLESIRSFDLPLFAKISRMRLDLAYNRDELTLIEGLGDFAVRQVPL